jgi:arabinose-5-phosphate isomerase
MHASPNISAGANWLTVVTAISKHALGAVNVIDDDGSLIGIITDGDLRRTIEKTQPQMLADLTSSDMMTREPITVTAQTLAYEALKLMEDRSSQIAVLPVIDNDGRASGLIRLHDIVRSGL